MTAGRLLGDRYQVGELLGYGGMAEVHRGRDLRLGRDVAIKMLRTDLARDSTFQMRFRREAQNAASLNHPAIVAVYDTGEERLASGEIIPFIVMEFVNGRTLKEVLAAEGRLQPRRALEITADMCAALEFSHRHGIIHRDIKPGNVMLTLTGQVKVMDFGIARALASGATTMTQTSAVIGTAQYLSPEQARGEAVDARSDVYAAGCVLYELMCGQPPFVGDSPVSVAYQHVREDAKAPSIISPEVNQDVDAIVLKALSKNPANRYQSAAEMRADLLRAAAGRPVSATPVLAEQASAAANVTTGSIPRTGTPARVGDRKRRRASGWVLATLTILVVLATAALGIGVYLANRTPKSGVPDVLNKPQADAVKLILDAKLTPEVGAPKADPACTKGTVLEQSPESGLKVAQGSKVSLVICGGPDMATVPISLVNLKQDQAERSIKEAGLNPVFKPQDCDFAKKDLVLAVEPKEGAKAILGSDVQVTVCAGNMKAVPDVRNLDVNEAKQRLEDAGFTRVSSNEEETTDASKDGKVIRQTPAPNPNALVKLDSSIVLIVGKFTEVEPTDTGTPSPPASPTP